MDLIQHRQFQVAFLAGLLQERNMLEEVGVQFLIRKGQVWFYIIRELDDLQVYAFFSQLRFYKIQQFRMRHRGRPHFYNDFFAAVFWCVRRSLFTAVAAAAQHQQGCHRYRQNAVNKFFHVSHSFIL